MKRLCIEIGQMFTKIAEVHTLPWKCTVTKAQIFVNPVRLVQTDRIPVSDKMCRFLRDSLTDFDSKVKQVCFSVPSPNIYHDKTYDVGRDLEQAAHDAAAKLFPIDTKEYKIAWDQPSNQGYLDVLAIPNYIFECYENLAVALGLELIGLIDAPFTISHILNTKGATDLLIDVNDCAITVTLAQNAQVVAIKRCPSEFAQLCFDMQKIDATIDNNTPQDFLYSFGLTSHNADINNSIDNYINKTLNTIETLAVELCKECKTHITNLYVSGLIFNNDNMLKRVYETFEIPAQYATQTSTNPDVKYSCDSALPILNSFWTCIWAHDAATNLWDPSFSQHKKR